MALQLQYTHDKFEYQDAYIRIVKIRTAKIDMERFEIVNDPDRPDVAERLTWECKMENVATFYVYSDKMARDNRVTPIHYGSFDFEYNINSPVNIYAQAYYKLRDILNTDNIQDV